MEAGRSFAAVYARSPDPSLRPRLRLITRADEHHVTVGREHLKGLLTCAAGGFVVLATSLFTAGLFGFAHGLIDGAFALALLLGLTLVVPGRASDAGANHERNERPVDAVPHPPIAHPADCSVKGRRGGVIRLHKTTLVTGIASVSEYLREPIHAAFTQVGAA
jgi:hypothetical protein